MNRIWNGKNLDFETPELGLKLEFASLIPEFASQLYLSGLCTDTDKILVTPLDDLKSWLREHPSNSPGIVQEVASLLLGQEEKDRQAAAKSGQKFDLVDYELGQMQADASYELFNPEWLRDMLSLAVEEADALQGWAVAELKSNFSINASFSLPDPRKHPLFKSDEIEASLKAFGAGPELLDRVLRGKGRHPEYSGMLMMELCARDRTLSLKGTAETAFVRVGLADTRAGDLCDAMLHLAYPRELEGYFLMSFDRLRQQITLKKDVED
jgi:hypothetical protein